MQYTNKSYLVLTPYHTHIYIYNGLLNESFSQNSGTVTDPLIHIGRARYFFCSNQHCHQLLAYRVLVVYNVDG